MKSYYKFSIETGLVYLFDSFLCSWSSSTHISDRIKRLKALLIRKSVCSKFDFFIQSKRSWHLINKQYQCIEFLINAYRIEKVLLPTHVRKKHFGHTMKLILFERRTRGRTLRKIAERNFDNRRNRNEIHKKFNFQEKQHETLTQFYWSIWLPLELFWHYMLLEIKTVFHDTPDQGWIRHLVIKPKSLTLDFCGQNLIQLYS